MYMLSGIGFHAHNELSKQSVERISVVGNADFSAVHGHSFEPELLSSLVTTLVTKVRITSLTSDLFFDNH